MSILSKRPYGVVPLEYRDQQLRVYTYDYLYSVTMTLS